MSERLHVATRKGLFTVKHAGQGEWRIRQTAFHGDHVSMVLNDPRDGTLFAALNHGHFGVKIHRSRDGGLNWEECPTPAFPPRPKGKEDLNPIRKTPIPWAVQDIWALEPGGPDEPGVIWCGTIPGGLFRSEDAGDSWEINRPLWNMPARKRWTGGGADYPAIHSILVDPRDSNHITVGVSVGGVWITHDGGATWQCGGPGMRAEYAPPEHAEDPAIQDPHIIVQCRRDPETLWAQHHNGIFRSTNGAESWTEITEAGPSTFGFAVAVHPHDPDTAWFVPAQKDEKRVPVDGRVVVTRTRDGGKSFDILTDGLPQEQAHDIVYRHALDVDGYGDRLAFGSTTGNLWISEDAGSSWLQISGNLPPIYAVRFVD